MFVTSNVHIVERSLTGRVIQERHTENVITSGGLVLMANYLGQTDPALFPAPPSFIAFSPNTTPVGYFWTSVPNETFRQGMVGIQNQGLSVSYFTGLSNTDNTGNVIGTYGLIAGNA